MEKMKEIFSLKGKTAVVTGASRGLGYSIAKGLASFGADLAVVSRDHGRLEAARKSLEKEGTRVCSFPLDLADSAEIPRCFEEIASRTSPDILVNNAGINIRERIFEAQEENWNRIMEVNCRSLFIMSRCFVRFCRQREKPGRIINITSLAAEGAREKIGIYSASKGAVKQLTKSFATKCGRYNINVNAIGPGYFKTEMNKPLAEDTAFDGWVREKTSLGRWGEPDELAGAAVFLASEASKYVNGQTIYVDGGWLAKL